MKRLLLIMLLSFSTACLFGMDNKINKYQKDGHLLCSIAQISEVLSDIRFEIFSNHKTPIRLNYLKFNRKEFIKLQNKLCRKLENKSDEFKKEQIKVLAKIWCESKNSSYNHIEKYICEVRECYGEWLFRKVE